MERVIMKLEGRAWKFGFDVDTDAIIPARYLNQTDPGELAKHAMEDERPEFVREVKKGDILVAMKNFGCGSSGTRSPGLEGSRDLLRHRRELRSHLLPEWIQPGAPPPRILRGVEGDTGRRSGSGGSGDRRNLRPDTAEKIFCKTHPTVYARADRGWGVDPSPSKKRVEGK